MGSFQRMIWLNLTREFGTADEPGVHSSVFLSYISRRTYSPIYSLLLGSSYFAAKLVLHCIQNRNDIRGRGHFVLFPDAHGRSDPTS